MKIFLPLFAVIAIAAAQITERCEEPNGFFPHETKCDAFYICEDGRATEDFCPDGQYFVFNPTSFRPQCAIAVGNVCEGKLQQQPIPSDNCKRQWGMFRQEDCSRFWYCVDGTAHDVPCPPETVFNEDIGVCDHPQNVAGCAGPEYPITCPEQTELEAALNPHPLVADPDSCNGFYICMSGKNPRHHGCEPGKLFDDNKKQCVDEVDAECGSRPRPEEPAAFRSNTRSNDEDEHNENEFKSNEGDNSGISLQDF